MEWTSKQSGIAALYIIMIVLACIAILLRAWACIVLRKTGRKIGLDDYLAFAALPFVVATNGVFVWWVADGLGRHATTVPTADFLRSSLIIYVAELLYDFGVTLPKLSVLFFYHRIFQKTSIIFTYFLWGLGFASVGWLIGGFFSSVFQCSPVKGSWEPLMQPPPVCLSQWDQILGTAITSVLIDVLILLAPLPRLWSLKMKKSRKLLVILVFLAGYSVVVCSVGRLIVFAQITKNYQRDVTWIVVKYINWVACEGPVSVICISLPAIYHFLKGIRDHGWQYAWTGEPLQLNKPAGSKLSWFSFSSNRLRAELAGFQEAGETDATATRQTTRSISNDVYANPDQVKIKKNVDVYQESHL